MLNTIIFDMDGVVIDSETLWDQASTEFLKGHGRVYDRAGSKHLCTGKAVEESTVILQQIYQDHISTI